MTSNTRTMAVVPHPGPTAETRGPLGTGSGRRLSRVIMFALGVFAMLAIWSGPEASAQIVIDQPPCVTDGSCSVTVVWECDSTVQIFGRGPTSFTVRTTLTPVDGSDPIVIDGIATTPSFAVIWSYNSGTIPIPRGEYIATASLTGTDSAGLPYTAVWGPQEITTDCVQVDLSCTSITATLLNDGSDKYPPNFGSQTLAVYSGNGEALAAADLTQTGAASIPLPGSGLYRYEVDESGGESYVLYDAGTIACLEPAVSCIDGSNQVTLFSADRSGPPEIDEIVATLTAPGGAVEYPAEAGSGWPFWQFIFDGVFGPGLPIDFLIDHGLAYVGIIDHEAGEPLMTVRCQVGIFLTCQQGAALPVADLTDTPDGTTYDILPSLNLASPGDVVTATVGELFSVDVFPNGVWWSGVGGPTVELVVPDCLATVDVICQSGVALPIVDLDPAPDGFDRVTVTMGADRHTFSVPSNSGVLLESPAWFGDPTTDIVVPNPDCEVEAEIACTNGDARLRLDASATILTGATIGGTLYPVDGNGEITVTVDGPEVVVTLAEQDLALVAADGSTLDYLAGTYEARLPVWDCLISAFFDCGVGADGLPNGTPEFRIVTTYGLPPGTQIYVDGVATGDSTPFDPTLGSSFVTLTADNGVVFTFSDGFSSSPDVRIPICRIDVSYEVECIGGEPRVQFSVVPDTAPGNELVTNGVSTGEPFQYWFSPDVTAPITFTWDYLIYDGVALYDAVLGALVDPVEVNPYRCVANVGIACADGTATLLTDLGPGSDHPPGTTISTSAPLDPGAIITVQADQGVWLRSSSLDDAPSLDLTVPYCTITISATQGCNNGTPAIRLDVGPGSYEAIEVQNGTESLGNTWLWNDPTAPLAYSLVGTGPGVVVIPEPGVAFPFTCVIDAAIVCQAGQAVVTSDLTNTPPGTTLTPTIGTVLTAGAAVDITVDNGVLFGNGAAVLPSIAPRCSVAASVACEAGPAGPTGRAILSITTAGTPGSSAPVDGSEMPQGTTVDVTVDSGLVFADTNTTTASIAVPQCGIDLVASAACAAGGITLTITTTGADPDDLRVDGSSVTPDPSGITSVGGLDAAAGYVVAVVAADSAVLVPDPTNVPLSLPCALDVSVTAACIGDDQVLITLTPTLASTGSIASASVNGDSVLPYVVTPGSGPLAITVLSDDTLPADITVGAAAVPASCAPNDDPVVPSYGTTIVRYTAECVDQSSVEVTVVADPGVITLSVNADGAAPYLVAPGDPITVSVLVVNALDFALLDGPATAPDCPADPTPEPEPTEPPLVIVIPDPVVTPDAAPEPTSEQEPTPEPTPEQTPEPTPEQTPEPTPEPTSEPTAEPTPEPTPEQTPEPDEVLERTLEPPIPPAVAIRQHGLSTVELPSSCDVDEIDLPGAVKLRKVETAGDSTIYSTDGATLDVGEYKKSVTCGDDTVEVSLFVYHQIGGARGEANSVSRLAATGAVLSIVLLGAPRLVGRRSTNAEPVEDLS